MTLLDLYNFSTGDALSNPANPTTMLPTPDAALQLPERTKARKPCACDAPVTSVIDGDIGLDDESASVVIVGGGPHALAALAALHEGSLGFQQYGDDGFFQARVGFGSLQKVGTGARSPTAMPCPAASRIPPTVVHASQSASSTLAQASWSRGTPASTR